MVQAELHNDFITRCFLSNECRVTEFFSGYTVNFVKHVRSKSPDMLLADEELYAVQAWKNRSESSTRAVAHLELTVDELLEIHAQEQVIEEPESLDFVQSIDQITVESLTQGLSLIEKRLRILGNIDSNVELVFSTEQVELATTVLMTSFLALLLSMWLVLPSSIPPVGCTGSLSKHAKLHSSRKIRIDIKFLVKQEIGHKNISNANRDFWR
ncbi:hypothetical protein TNCV_419871 [Trichonephila clavipes]|uniref:Uncharacterized protein n=1 Tax=Trichonephila clavipes TaxID=2585209 RepID=A0A8X6VEA9_TRICX|nr:hypothetical protein TNCV_419871 [Trichonephila clavipes]